MAVAHDAVAESHTGTTASISETSFTWQHNPVGTPAGVLVFVVNMVSAANIVSSVTYDGTTVPLVSGGEAADTADETGYCSVYFLGASVPTTDPADVVVNRTNNTDELWASSVTVIAAADTEVTGIVLLEEDGTLAEVSVNDGSPGTNSMRYMGGFSGLNSIPSAGTNTTGLLTFDTGIQTAWNARETTAGQGSRLIGFDSGTTASRAQVYLAVREVTGTTVTPATIARSFTLPAPTVKGSAVTTPSTVARSFTVPAPTVKGSAVTTPAAVATIGTPQAVTVKGSAVTTPAAVAWSFTVPQATAGAGGTAGSASPAAIVTIGTPQAPTVKGSAVTTPDVIARLFTLPTSTQKGSAVTTPATIAQVFTLPASTQVGSAVVTPSTIAQAFTLPSSTQKGSAVTTPGTIARLFVIPQATAVGGGAGATSPATIARAFVIPQATAIGSQAGSASPGVIALAYVLGGVTVAGGATAQPSVIPLAFLLPATTQVGAALVTPGTIVVVLAMPAVTAFGGAITFWTRDPLAYVRDAVAYVRDAVVYVKIEGGDTPPWN